MSTLEEMKAIKKSKMTQQKEVNKKKERKNKNTNEHNVISSTKEEIEKLKERFEKDQGNTQSYDFSTMTG